MGLEFLVKEQYQLPQMNAVRCPEGVNEAEVRKTLLNEFSIEIGAGLGPLAGKIWRIGIMGYSCRPDKRDAVPVGARLGALRHGHEGPRRRRGSRRPSGVCGDARQSRAAEQKSRVAA